MTDSLLVERVNGKLVLTLEYADGTPSIGNGKPTTYNDEQLHTELVQGGWLRVGPAKGDDIAGLYVRKVAA